MMSNQTITSQMSEKEVELIDKLVTEGKFCSRSDAIRTLVREGLKQKSNEDE